MIEMLLLWLVAPLLLALLSYGIGLIPAMALRRPMTFTLTTSLGFVLIAILGSFLTSNPATAPHTAIIIALVSGVTLIIAALWFTTYFRFDLPSILAGLLTYVAYSLPFFIYGRPTWAGWIKLDDNSTFLAVTDRLMNVGRTVPAEITSTFDRVIQMMFVGDSGGRFSYPVGALIPFGTVSKLTGLESAWLYQPYLSFCAALAAMLFLVIVRKHNSGKIAPIIIASLAVLASTMYSYVMWGGIKEIVILIPLTLFAYTFVSAAMGTESTEYFLYSIIGFIGLILIGGTAALGFAAPILIAVLLIKIFSRNRTLFYGILAASGIATAGIVYYLKFGLKSGGNFLIPAVGDQGNLSRSLNMAQLLGIWPAQDFRMDPVNRPLAYFAIAMACAFALAGMYFASSRSLWFVPILILSCVGIVSISYFWGGIWITGKAIAIASPFLVLTAGIGAIEAWRFVGNHDVAWMRANWIRYVLGAMVAVVGLGVVVSDAFTYKNIYLAPYTQLDELRTIGKLYAGQGPTLMTEYSVYGSRYFLRNLDAEAVSELRVHVIPIRDGSQVPRGGAADIDFFNPATIDYFNLLVLRKAPNASRPPLDYSLVWSGTTYEVWKRSDRSIVVKATLPLGSIFYPGATPSCKNVNTFLVQRLKTDKIFAAIRKKVYVVDFANGDLPTGWQATGGNSGGVDRAGDGGFSRNFTVDENSDYDMWIAGSFPGRLRIQVDGREVYSGNSIFEENSFLTNPLTRVHLPVGAHVLTVLYDSPLVLPGADAASRFGPIYLSTQTAGDVQVKQISISRIPQLCTQNLDWIAITN